MEFHCKNNELINQSPINPVLQGVNMVRTDSKSDTPLTRSVRYAVVGPSGDVITGFDTAIHAVDWARRTWPGLEQDEDRTGKGWDVQVAGS
jgi:hypothetical protein